MFRAHVLIIRRSKLHYTASGIITPICGRLVHETATYKCYDTRGCVIQFWPSDDEHMCSKHVEAWNKNLLWNKFCASSWLNTEINILRCTVSKTSKKNMYIVCYVPVFSTMIRAWGSALEVSWKTSETAIACCTDTAQNKYTQQI